RTSWFFSKQEFPREYSRSQRSHYERRYYCSVSLPCSFDLASATICQKMESDPGTAHCRSCWGANQLSFYKSNVCILSQNRTAGLYSTKYFWQYLLPRVLEIHIKWRY